MPARADEWSKTYTLTGKPDLRVETSDANIHVSTWDQSSIEARVTTTGYKIGEDGIRIEEHQTGNMVEIDVRYPHHGVTINLGSAIGHRVDIDIHMPREGRVDLHTGDGKIDLGNFKGEMVLRSGDGSQEIDGVDGKLRATTGDGHIRANGRFDELELKTGDGRLDARAASWIGAGHGLEAGERRRHRHAGGTGEPGGRCGSAHRRRPHRSGYAGHNHRQDSRKRGSRQAQRRRKSAGDSYRRWIDHGCARPSPRLRIPAQISKSKRSRRR